MKTQFKMLITLLLLVGLIFGTVVPFVEENMVAEAQQEQYTVNYVWHAGLSDPYWKKMQLGAEAASALYPDLKMNFIGPDAFNFEQFMNMLSAAIVSKPDGLIVPVCNPIGMDEILRNAIKKGLPVLAVDSADDRAPAERIPYMSYVGENSYLGGIMAADEILKVFRPKRAIYGNHTPGATNLTARGNGFLDVMKEKGIPAEALDITPDPVKGTEILVSYLKRNPDTDCVFTANILFANALIVRLEEEGMKPGINVKTCTFGLDDQTLGFMEEDKIMFSIDEQPYLQGYLSTIFMYLHLKYKFTPPAEIPTLGIIYKKDLGTIKDLVEKDIR
ncbi:hypothetical protein ES708_04982 [subsurface metagenome]